MRILIATPNPNPETNKWTDEDIETLTTDLRLQFQNDTSLDLVPASLGWRRAGAAISGQTSDVRYFNWANYIATSTDVWKEPNYDEVWVPGIGFPSEDLYLGKATALIVAACIVANKPVRMIIKHSEGYSLAEVLDITETGDSQMHKFARMIIEQEE